MANAFIGEIRMFAGTFAPQGWALCNGQLMAIAENDALFTLIGTTYGGDGQSTFGLPNLQSRVPLLLYGRLRALGHAGAVQGALRRQTVRLRRVPARAAADLDRGAGAETCGEAGHPLPGFRPDRLTSDRQLRS